jgi:hypothetical protein
MRAEVAMPDDQLAAAPAAILDHIEAAAGSEVTHPDDEAPPCTRCGLEPVYRPGHTCRYGKLCETCADAEDGQP